MQETVLKKYFLKVGYQKKLFFILLLFLKTGFFPLHPISFCGQDHEKQKRLVTSLSLGCKAYLEKNIF